MADDISKKRVYCPTGRTPHKPKSKRSVGDKEVPKSVKKKLSFHAPVQNWSEEEDSAITICLAYLCKRLLAYIKKHEAVGRGIQISA